MSDFIKSFLRGLIVTVLLPVIVLVLACYAVYCTFSFVVMLIRNAIVFFAGGNIDMTKEDYKAQEILNKTNKTQEDMTQVLSGLMHQAIVQNPEAVQAMAAQQIEANKMTQKAQEINQIGQQSAPHSEFDDSVLSPKENNND